MADSPTDLPVSRYAAGDGQQLAFRETGEGRPVVLVHGYFSSAWTNWIRYGHAELIAAAGFRVIMPDLRAHGESAKPHDPAAYPPDVLVDDLFALIAHLELTDYDLVGYSLGGRTAVRMLARGATPRRAVISGMGLDGIVRTGARGRYFRHVLTNLGSFDRGSAEWMTEAFLKTTRGDPVALLNILDTFVDTPREQLAEIGIPCCVINGVDDDDNGSGQALADALGNGRFVEIPGNHMSAVARSDLGIAIRDYLLS
ncbi:MAG: alpha/beta fold hydrolase [Sphingomonadaceae bacterium]